MVGEMSLVHLKFSHPLYWPLVSLFSYEIQLFKQLSECDKKQYGKQDFRPLPEILARIHFKVSKRENFNLSPVDHNPNLVNLPVFTM